MRSLKSWSAFLVVCLTLVAGQLAAATTHVNAKIAFDTNRDGNNEIYVMNQDGTGQTRLTNDPAGDFGPAWSPDGMKIAFNKGFDIFVMEADGTSQTRLTSAAAMNIAPSWSPDGTKIAFHSSRDGNFEIYVMDADGNNQTRLTSNAAGDFAPSWSPDGQRLVFRSNRDGNNEIYVMAKDGTAQTRVTVNTADDQEPKFSGDGTKIIFTRSLSTRQITVVNADGTNPVQLTTAGNNFFPSVSPDGTKIAFVSDRDGNHEIYSMDVDGNPQVRLTNNFTVDEYPSWQPSGFLIETVGVYRPTTGQWLLRTSNTSGSPNLTFTFGGQPGDLPVAGDWNGDGRTDLGIFRNGTFLRGVLTTTPACFRCFSVTTVEPIDPVQFGQAGDRPIAGDWNGDGIDDIGVYRSNTSTFLLRIPGKSIVIVPCHGCPSETHSTFTTFTAQFGSAGDLPVTGDWEGDGKDTIGVFHDGVFLVTSDFFETSGSSVFGFIGDLPLAGDWTGTGRGRLGLFHPSTAAMSLETKLGEGPDINFTFGSASDLPVAGHWTAVAP